MNEGSGKKSVREIVNSMNKNTLGIIICAAVLLLTLVVFLATRGVGSHANSNNEEPEASMTVEEASQIGDSNMKDVSVDSEDGEAWRTINDKEYNVTIDALGEGYSGEFVEDGSDKKVKNVLALKFTNNGTKAIQYGEYVFDLKGEVASFKFSNLPAGQSCIALEINQHSFKNKDILSIVSRVVAQVDELPFANDQVLVVDNSDNTITIMNLTDKELPAARAFYKTFDEENNVFIGGITYTAKVENVPAGGSVTVKPSHYVSGKSVVVGSGVYDSGK